MGQDGSWMNPVSMNGRGAISNIVTEKWVNVNYIEKTVIGKVILDGIERIENS